MAFFSIKALTCLCLIIFGVVDGASIPGFRSGSIGIRKSSKRQARTPLCSATDTQSPFFKETTNYFQTTYLGFLNTATGLLKALPDSLDTDGNSAEQTMEMRCTLRPTNDLNPMVYPQLAAGSSDCLRRDQDVHYITYRNLFDLKSAVAPLATYYAQGPTSFDPATCPDRTSTYAEFSAALDSLAVAVSAYLDEVDRQTCLVSLTNKAVTYKILFDRANESSIDQLTALYSIQQIVNVAFNGAIYRGETFDSAAMAAIQKVNNRFAQTKAFMDTRKDCSQATKDRCKELKVPLKQEFFLVTLLNLIFQIPTTCPADMRDGFDLGGLLPGTR